MGHHIISQIELNLDTFNELISMNKFNLNSTYLLIGLEISV